MKFLIKEISPSRKEVRLTLNPVNFLDVPHYILGQVDGNFEYEEFYGNDEWYQYHMEPIVYNRAIFYNGNNFHSALVPDGFDDWRYSLVLMGGLDREV